jgi:hypothetical protein
MSMLNQLCPQITLQQERQEEVGSYPLSVEQAQRLYRPTVRIAAVIPVTL